MRAFFCAFSSYTSRMKRLSLSKTLLVTLLLFAAQPQAKVLYKLTHADGSVTYTDVPQAGAVALDLSKSNSATMPALALPPKALVKHKQQLRPQIDYQLRLLEPADNQSLRSNNGLVKIRAKLQPAKAGQYLLIMDGKQLARSTSGYFMLENVDRGSHQIQVKFSNQSGKVIASTPLQRFHLQRVSLLINRN